MARIMVIDNEEFVLNVLREMLSREEHEIVTATNGVEGITLFNQQAFDLVIVDILMPQKDGLDTIREMMAINPQTRIIAISGGGRSGVLDFLPVAEVFGALRTLAKPFERHELIEAVNAALSRQTETQQ